MHFRCTAKILFFISLTVGSGRLFATHDSSSGTRHLERHGTSVAVATAAPRIEQSLPPLPAGVAELNFSTLFKTPVGPRGLEIADPLLALDGRRVRIFGYMVREQAADHDEPAATENASDPAVKDLVADRFLLTATPQATNFSHYGLCEDLPPQTVYVTRAEPTGAPVTFTPRPLLLTGVLSVGIKNEPDGRTSIIRLQLDPIPPANR